jgi:hypothetical protein
MRVVGVRLLISTWTAAYGLPLGHHHAPQQCCDLAVGSWTSPPCASAENASACLVRLPSSRADHFWRRMLHHSVNMPRPFFVWEPAACELEALPPPGAHGASSFARAFGPRGVLFIGDSIVLSLYETIMATRQTLARGFNDDHATAGPSTRLPARFIRDNCPGEPDSPLQQLILSGKIGGLVARYSFVVLGSNHGSDCAHRDAELPTLFGAMAALRAAAPGARLIWLTEIVGHRHCPELMLSPPLARVEPEMLTWHGWHLVQDRARRRVDALRRADPALRVLNVTELSALRADGHRGLLLRPVASTTGKAATAARNSSEPTKRLFLDCLHYEQNGPMNEWMRMLMTLIRHWESSAGSSVGGAACASPQAQPIGSASAAS